MYLKGKNLLGHGELSACNGQESIRGRYVRRLMACGESIADSVAYSLKHNEVYYKYERRTIGTGINQTEATCKDAI